MVVKIWGLSVVWLKCSAVEEACQLGFLIR